MEAPGSSKTLVNICQTTQYHIPEDFKHFTFYAVLDATQQMIKKTYNKQIFHF
jgi:hypothetical protein